MEAVAAMERSRALFGLTLGWTGARAREVLALTPASFQLESGVLTIATLERGRHCMRESAAAA